MLEYILTHQIEKSVGFSSQVFYIVSLGNVSYQGSEAYFYGNFFNLELGNNYDSLMVHFLYYDYSRSGSGFDFSYYENEEKKAKYEYLCGGHQYLKMELTYLRNGAEESKIDSVFIESGDTFTGTVYY